MTFPHALRSQPHLSAGSLGTAKLLAVSGKRCAVELEVESDYTL